MKSELKELVSKWYEFGKKLKVSSSALHTIEKETGRDAEYYFEQLLSYLVDDQSSPGVTVTWGRVVKVVRELGEETIAEKVACKYGKEEGRDGGSEGRMEGGKEGGREVRREGGKEGGR